MSPDIHRKLLLGSLFCTAALNPLFEFCISAELANADAVSRS